MATVKILLGLCFVLVFDMSNFFKFEIRGDDSSLKATLNQIPNLLRQSGTAAESQSKRLFGEAGRVGGVAFNQSLQTPLASISNKFGSVGRESGSVFSRALNSSVSVNNIAAKSTQGISAKWASVGRESAIGFTRPFLDAGKKIANSLKANLDSVKQGIGQGIGQSISGGLINGALSAVSTGLSGKNASDQDAATRKNATLQLGNAGGDTKKALVLSEQLTKELGALNKELGFVTTTSKATESAYAVLSTGFTKNSDAIEIMRQGLKGAATDGSDVNVTVDGLTSVLGALGLGAKDAGYAMQQMVGTVDVGKISMEQYSSLIGNLAPTLGKIGSNTKMQFEQANAIIAMSTANGLKSGAAINGLRQAYSSLLKPSKEARDEADKLGLSLTQKNLNDVGLLGFMKQLAQTDLKGELQNVVAAAKQGEEALSALGEKPSVNLTKLLTIFGSVEAVAAVASAAGVESVKKVEDAVSAIKLADVGKKFDIVMDGLAKKQEAFANKMTDLDAQLKSGFFADTAAKGLEYMNKAVDGTIKALARLDKWYKSLSPGNKELVKNIALAAAGVAALGVALIAIGGVIAIVSTAIGGLAVVFNPVTAAIVAAIATVVSMGLAFKALAKDATSAWNSVSSAVGTWAKNVANIHRQLWGYVLSGGKGNYDSQLAAGNKFFSDNLKALDLWAKSWGNIFKAVSDKVGGFFDEIGKKFNWLSDQIKGFMGMETSPKIGGGNGVSPGVRPAAPGDARYSHTKKYGHSDRHHDGPGYEQRGYGLTVSKSRGLSVKDLVLAGGTNADIPSPVAGKVKTYTPSDNRGFGYEVQILDANNKIIALLAHMDKLLVKDGDMVVAGSAVGKQGNTGRSNGIHLHVEMPIGMEKEYMRLIKQGGTAQPSFKGSATSMKSEIKVVLDLIGDAENVLKGNDQYYARQGNGKFSADEARRGFPSVGKNENVGKYQVNKGDYEEARRKDPSITNFSPENQDKIALLRMKNPNGRGGDKGWTALQRLMRERTQANYDALLDDLGAEWESLRDNSVKNAGLDRRINKRAEGQRPGFVARAARELGVGQPREMVKAMQKTNAPQAIRTLAGEQRSAYTGYALGPQANDYLPKANTKKVRSDDKTIAKAMAELSKAEAKKSKAAERLKKQEEKAKEKTAKKLEQQANSMADIERLQLGVDSVNADSNAELSRAQLDVDLGINSEAAGRKKKALIEQRRTKNLAVYFKQLNGLMAKYQNNDIGLNQLKGIESNINQSQSQSIATKKESGLDAITNLENKFKEINEKFSTLKLGVEEKRSQGKLSEAGAANETSYLSQRQSTALQSTSKDAARLMASYKDPAALDRLRAITTQIKQQGIEARDAEKSRKASNFDVLLEKNQKAIAAPGKKYQDELAVVDALAKSGMSEAEALKMKLALQQQLVGELMNAIPAAQRFAAAYKDTRALEVSKELLANTRAARAELTALEKEVAGRSLTENVAKTDKLQAGGDRSIKDVQDRQALGQISEAKALKEILGIRLATNKAIQDGARILEGYRDTQTDPAIIELYNEQLAKLRQINVETVIAEKQYEDANIAASTQGQIMESTKQGMADLFMSLGKGAKDFNSILDGVLNKIADIAISELLGSFGGGGSGSGLLGMIGSVLGFKAGGDVPKEGGIKSLAGISKALKKEGSNAVLATLTPGERVLNQREAAIHRAMIADGTWKQATKIYGYKAGGDVGNVSARAMPARSTQGNIPAVRVDQINGINYVSVEQLQGILAVQLPAAARAGAAMTERNLQSTSWRQNNGIK